MQDKTDDKNVGIRSTALLFGENTRLVLTGLSAASLSLISLAGVLNAQSIIFFTGVGVAAAQLARVQSGGGGPQRVPRHGQGAVTALGLRLHERAVQDPDGVRGVVEPGREVI